MAEATNKMLQFKMGLHANLPTTKQAGTVYVTTDEQAMYVDINDNDRIRLSDIIQVETVNKLRDMAPKYSSTALYYVIDENALLKYTGNGTTTHTWKQVNSVSDVQASVTKLTTDVSTLQGEMKSVKDALNGTPAGEGVEATTGLIERVGDVEDAISGEGGLEARLTAAEGNIGKNAQAITGINDAIGADGTAGTVKGRIKTLETELGTTKSNLTSLSQTVGNAEGGLVKDVADVTKTANDATALLGDADDTKTDATAFGKIAGLREDLGTAQGDITNLKNSVNTINNTELPTIKGDVKGNKDAIAELKAAVGEGAEGLAGKVTSIEDTLNGKGENPGLVAKVSTAESNITTLQTDLNNLVKKDGVIDGLEVEIGQNKSDIGKVSGVANQNKTDIEGLTTRVGNLETADTQIIAAANTLKGRVDGIDTAIGSDNVADSIKGRLKAVEDKAATNLSDITKLKGDKDTAGSVAYAVDQAEQRLNTKIANDINAANAMDYKGAIEAVSELDSKTGVKAGDTYVLTKTAGDNKAGDLFIASGEEVNGVITGTVTWNHVKTGYDASLEPTLGTSGDKITLTTHAGEAKGHVQFVAAANSSATVEVDANVVTVGMAWGSF